MSMYTLLDTPIPTIAYCALHQAHPDVPREEYMKTMKELHQRVAKETADINEALTKSITEAIAKESQSVRNTLSQFLHMPISSDNEDVQQILVDSFERLRNQLLDGVPLGLEESCESKVFFVSSKKALETKLLKSGKAYLDELGFNTAKGHPDIFESQFIIKGAANLDVLEHIVRDRLGIYSTTHGKHIKEFQSYSYGAYNLVFAKGTMSAKDAINKSIEMTFYFSKPDVKYAPFRSGLTDALEKLSELVSIDHVSLWQRKLGLGSGREFILRVVSGKSEVAAEVIQWLNAYEEKTFVREALIEGGNLVVKELLFR